MAIASQKFDFKQSNKKVNVSVKHLSQFGLLVVACLLFAYLLQGELRGLSLSEPPSDYSAAHDVDVVMYGASWCGYCAKARRYMDRHAITYIEHDIDTSIDGRREYKDLGGKAVPLFQIGGQVLKGYRPERIAQLVEEKRLSVSEHKY